jgi:protein-tyrosine-phosphatase
MARHPTYKKDVTDAVRDLLAPYLNRRRILFVSANGAGRSQMAAAFVRIAAGDRFDVRCAGHGPAARVLPAAAAAMRKKGIDLGFLRPQPLAPAIDEDMPPETVVIFGGVEGLPPFEGARIESWDLPSPDPEDDDAWQDLAEEIEQRANTLIE